MAFSSAWGKEMRTCDFPSTYFLGDWRYVGVYEGSKLVNSEYYLSWPAPLFTISLIQDKRLPKARYTKDFVRLRSKNSMRNLLYSARILRWPYVDSLFPICRSYYQDSGYLIFFVGRGDVDLRISRLTNDSLYIPTGNCVEYKGAQDCLMRSFVYVKVNRKEVPTRK